MSTANHNFLTHHFLGNIMFKIFVATKMYTMANLKKVPGHYFLRLANAR
jgi:hypothetical protein